MTRTIIFLYSKKNDKINKGERCVIKKTLDLFKDTCHLLVTLGSELTFAWFFFYLKYNLEWTTDAARTPQ